MADTPHFDLPFRLLANGKDVEVNEQDSLEEVGDSVEALMRTPLGWREESPNFGVSDQAFSLGGPDLDEIQTAITQHEPRADAIIDAQPDLLDAWVSRVELSLGVRSVG